MNDFSEVSILEQESVWPDIGDFEVPVQYVGDLKSKIDSIFHDALDKVNIFTHVVQFLSHEESELLEIRESINSLKESRAILLSDNANGGNNSRITEVDLALNRYYGDLSVVANNIKILKAKKLALDKIVSVFVSGLEAYKSL